MGLMNVLERFRKPVAALPIKLWTEYSLEEKERMTGRSCGRMVLRGYALLGASPLPRLTDVGITAIKDYVANPMERKELEDILKKVCPSPEFNEFDYYVKFNDLLLLSAAADTIPFYQRLNEKVSNIRGTLDTENFTVTDFQLLLGAYILDQAETQRLIESSPTMALMLTKKYIH